MLGEAPSGWVSVPLSRIAKITMGETLLSKDLTATGVPVFSANTDDGPWGYTDQNRKTLRRGTIVIGARGSIGYPRLPPYEEFTSTQTTMSVEPDSAIVDSDYLHAVLCAADIKSIAAQQAVPMLTIGMLAPLPILLPPLQEQQRISDVLRSVGETVSANEQQRNQCVRILSQYRREVFSPLVKEPVGGTTLGEICSLGRGFAFKSDDYVEDGFLNFRVTNAGRSIHSIGEAKFLPRDYIEKFSEYKLIGDEIVLVMVGATVGKLGRVPAELCPALLNQNMWTLNPLGNLSRDILWHLAHVLIEEKVHAAQGGAYSFLTMKEFLQHRVGDLNSPAILPHAIAMSSIEEEIRALEAEASALERIRAHISSDLLNGCVRVPA